MLIQDHVNAVPEFLGQSTGFHKDRLKSGVLVLGEVEGANEAKYLHGQFGRGTFTFLGGHDPEDYQHMVGDPPTELSRYRHSPGYRLILNNVLFPAAEKKKAALEFVPGAGRKLEGPVRMIGAVLGEVVSGAEWLQRLLAGTGAGADHDEAAYARRLTDEIRPAIAAVRDADRPSQAPGGRGPGPAQVPGDAVRQTIPGSRAAARRARMFSTAYRYCALS